MLGFEQGRDMVGKVATFSVYGWFLLESAKDLFLRVEPPTPQNILCHHMSGMEELAN
jgi:hypothetical protein